MSNRSDFDDVLDLKRALLGLPDVPYLDRNGNRVRHPGGIFGQSNMKALQRIRTLTESLPLQAPREDVLREWPRVAGAVEAMLASFASHHDNLKVRSEEHTSELQSHSELVC